MIPLGLLSPGTSGEITEVRTHSLKGLCHCSDDESQTGNCRCVAGSAGVKSEARLEDMGLRVGKNVEMLRNGGGPVLIRIDESRIAVDRGMAMKIMVRRKE